MERNATVAVRLIGLFLALAGFALGLGNLLQALGEIDAIYIDLFFRARLVPPAVLLGTGIAVILLSRTLARWLLHGLAKD
ncbi:MAG TPA: hypothetical protein VIM58_11780 [Candidatus Methylacidiphilales bacterium]